MVWVNHCVSGRVLVSWSVAQCLGLEHSHQGSKIKTIYMYKTPKQMYEMLFGEIWMN